MAIERIRIRAHEHEVRYFDRPGPKRTIVLVHGLGNSSENFADLTAQPVLENHRLVAIDLPGCGETPYTGGSLDIDDLVNLVEVFVEQLSLRHVLLVGASMGGLVALLYAERRPERVSGFANVEGNLAPEDCMFSRLAVEHDFTRFETSVFPQIKRSLRERAGRGFAKHLQVLERANARAYFDYSFQTVEYSDHGRLLERFLGLPVPHHFIHGDANRHLSYLPALRESGCPVVEIPDADHFVFYDNPRAFAEALAPIT
jgi:pimeloyl-ACP methyl ester carboxylesterase